MQELTPHQILTAVPDNALKKLFNGTEQAAKTVDIGILHSELCY